MMGNGRGEIESSKFQRNKNFVRNSLEGLSVGDGVADDEHVGARVAQRTQTIVLIRAGSIPQTERDRLAVDDSVCSVVIENGRDVLTREAVRCVGDQEAGLAWVSAERERLAIAVCIPTLIDPMTMNFRSELDSDAIQKTMFREEYNYFGLDYSTSMD